MRNFSCSTLLICLFSFQAHAQTPTWASDIAPILYKHCSSCHRDGALGHFSLLGYDNAFSNRNEIKDATGAKRMPPWMPDPNYRHYAAENRLNDTEIQKIADWVDNNAPAGDLSQAPPMPVFSNESEVGMPDHILLLPDYTVTATDDEYRCFVIPTGLTHAAFLRGLEAIPGNHEVVHHILIYEDTTGQGKVLDQQTPNEPGYVNFGGPGVNGARLVGAWVPGSKASLLPPFMGVKLNPNADLIVQMHYPKGVTGMHDQTKLNLFFTPSNQNIREVLLAPILNHSPLSLENWPLSIPANTVKTFHEKYKSQQTGSIISVAPHMHLIGKDIKCFAVTPQNDTIPFIKIDNWDFHWQGGYNFQKVQKLPAQSVLHAYATYDNTTNNPNQPNDPPKLVLQGEATTDEMMLVYFAFMAYQPGDENIILDSTLLNTPVQNVAFSGTPFKIQISPNPVQDQLDLRFESTSNIQALNLEILDMNGRKIRQLAEQKHLVPGIYHDIENLQGLNPGLYVLRVSSANGEAVSQRFIKM